MKKLLVFIILLTIGLTYAVETPATQTVAVFQRPAEPKGFMLQTLGGRGQTIRIYQPAQKKFLLELNGSALYPALREQALKQMSSLPITADATGQQQLLQKTTQKLALNSGLISSLRAQIAQEQQQVMAAVHRISGAQVEQQFSQLTNLLLVSGPVTLPQLAAIPGVARVWPEQTYQITLSESIPKIKVPEVWGTKDRLGRTLTGQGVRIAVLDTGIDFTHPSLGGCLGKKCKVIMARNTLVNNDDVTDLHGHGTHVASIAAGKADTGNGVAPDARLMAIKVLNDQGSGYDSSIIAGIEYAVDPDGNPATDDGADIINMSLGGPGDAASPISQAAEKAVQSGVAVVVAAGNDWDYLSIGSPGAAPSVITVANVDRGDLVHYSSSRGPLVGAKYLKPEIGAPGDSIEAAKSGGGLTRLTGTSMAAPHVAGAAALLLQAQPLLTPQQVKRTLMQSVDLINATPAETGSGRLNVQRAIAQQYWLAETAVLIGRIPNDHAEINGTKKINFINPTTKAVTVTASVLNIEGSGLDGSFSQSEQVVPANSNVEFEFNYSGLSNDIDYPDNEGGAAGFQLVFDTPEQRLTLPVMYEKYQSLEIQHDGTLVELRFLDDNLIEHQYASGFSLDIPGTKQLRFRPGASLKHVFARLSVSDPKQDGRQAFGALRFDMPKLATGDVVLPVNKGLLSEYHKLNKVKFLGKTQDFADSTHQISSFAILQNKRPAVPVLYSFSWCEDGCSLPIVAVMLGGFDKGNWSFEQTFQYPQAKLKQPETRFFSWQAKAGNGSSQQKVSIEIEANNLIQFDLLPDKSPITGWAGYVWPFKAKPGDVMRVYQAGPVLLPETAPQIQHFDANDELIAHSGYFSASAAGTIRKWHVSETGPRQLVATVDFNTNRLPLASSVKAFTGAVAISENLSRIKLSQGPRNNSEQYHFPIIWHDQYLNAGYLSRDTSLQMRCNYGTSSRWGNTSFGDFLHHDSGCKEFILQVDGLAAQQLSNLPTVIFQMKDDGDFPRVKNLVLFNRSKISDVVSRIDHRLDFEVVSGENHVPISAIAVDFRTRHSSSWRTVYQTTIAGAHSLRLPISAETSVADLRIRIEQSNGNSMVQLLPDLLRIGASAGIDNDVDSDGIVNTMDADNDNDGVNDTDDALPFNPTETQDFDKDGIGNNADPDDDNDGVDDGSDVFPFDPTESADSDRDGIGNNADPDDDNDSVLDHADAFPLDPAESVDTDNDGIGNNTDPDDDNDGVADGSDEFPLDSDEWVDTDHDGIGNNADRDDDNDGVTDGFDAFPLDPSEAVDTDGDGIGNNADPDDDNDGVADTADAFPLDPFETIDSDRDGVGNYADTDDDNDGTLDVDDAFPLDPAETTDSDKDGIGNNADRDDDNDGTPDVSDEFPLDPTEITDYDNDGIGNNADPDDDNDGTPDISDALPFDPTESVDTDKDGIGNNADPDDDNDGVADTADAFPLDPAETLDTDKDGIGNNADPDDDNDGTPDVSDAFPLDPAETLDTDKDGIGNNADPDDDNDGVADTADAFPLDPKETLDSDKDGIGNNADPDDDNDGVADTADAFPLDPKESVDTDKDGIGNNADPDDDNDGVADTADAFPLDPKETLDTDKDGIGNNADADDDNDGVADTADAFPLDPKETTDTDKDGIGNNADPDDDNDGVADSSDKYPLDATRSSDPVTPNAGSSGSGGGGGAGLGGLLLVLPLLAWRRQRSQITNKAA